ncbi:MAG: GTPase ObgE [Candidatus Margulisbacteria bacterium]|nr:GTPase ObgE [Candidatus Margulisiibacteriota bacterium]
MFVDYAEIKIKAGHGGAGSVHFHREKYVPKGGPDGGDGGKGGDVIFQSDHNLKSLMDFNYQKEYLAGDGMPGGGRDCYGKAAIDLHVKVPVGTIVKNKETGETIIDFNADNMVHVMAKGGLGGKGNARFASSTNQTPFYAQKGLPGQEMEIILELKLIADVGIIGLPNVGKSSLISQMTHCKPKIANYPFTTLVPNLGVVKYKNEKEFIIADMPGLIEDAHHGHGLGIQFLRHIERTTILVHVLDISDFYNRDVLDDFQVINNELELYNPDIKKKEQIVVFNKIDAVADRKKITQLKKKFKKYQVLALSAATGEGVAELIDRLASKVT